MDNGLNPSRASGGLGQTFTQSGGSMSLFDALFELPGKIIELGVETVVRLPEIPIKIIEGVTDGITNGAEAVEKAFDELDGGL